MPASHLFAKTGELIEVNSRGGDKSSSPGAAFYDPFPFQFDQRMASRHGTYRMTIRQRPLRLDCLMGFESARLDSLSDRSLNPLVRGDRIF